LPSEPTKQGAAELPTTGDGVSHPRPPSTSESNAQVIYPTGVIVADADGPLYRSTGDTQTSETYIPMTDPDLAEDGTEHELVRYHSSAGAGDGSA